jgi:hypothetical protein
MIDPKSTLTTSIDLDQAAAALGIGRGHAQRLIVSLAAVRHRPRCNPYTVFCETWYLSLAALSHEDFEAAWRLADYWMLDQTVTDALAQEAVQRSCCALPTEGNLDSDTTPQPPPCLSAEHWRCSADTRRAAEAAFAHTSEWHGPGTPTPLIAVLRGMHRPSNADEVDVWTLWGHMQPDVSSVEAVLEAAGCGPTSRGFNMMASVGWLFAEGGHLAKLQCWRSLGLECDRFTAKGAAFGGHIEVLEWLHSIGCPFSQDTCAQAARGGHLSILQWLHNVGCPWDDFNVYWHAAFLGRLDILAYARDNGCPLPALGEATLCRDAALEGQLAALQWLRSVGCNWDEATCEYAALAGHLDVLQWARANGCPWDGEVFVGAYHYGHTDVLLWAVDHGCPMPVHAPAGLWLYLAAHRTARWARGLLSR